MFLVSLLLGSIAGVLFLYAAGSWIASLNLKNRVVDSSYNERK